MKKFLTTIKNIFAIDDLRVRILNTIGFIAIFRLGSYVVLPGVDPNQLKANTAGLFGLLDTFLGIDNCCSVFPKDAEGGWVR